MNLYLSSVGIPTPDHLAQLLGKPLAGSAVALIPNAQDYYAPRARDFKISKRVAELEALGFQVSVLDLRDHVDEVTLKNELAWHDLIWAMGGNTFCLRYEMRRSGFETVISELPANVVYGGDSAGALVAGLSIAGVEAADTPEFAEEIITDGLRLVPHVVLPHIDNPEFADVIPTVKALHVGQNDIIGLKDNQAVVFKDEAFSVVTAP